MPLEDADGELTYNGVVYNEMKGAFSSPDQVLSRKITSTLFPGYNLWPGIRRRPGQYSGADL